MTTDDPQKIKARLTDIAADVRDVYQDAVCCIADLQCQVSDLKQDRDEAIQARKNQTAHLEHIAAGNIGNFKTLASVPRIIAADELREGQLICIHRGHGWGVRVIGTFVNLEGDLATIKTGGSGTFTESTKFHTIVLLADAPDEQQEPERGSLRTWGTESGTLINTDPFNSAEPERLTVADLESAPVGSELSGLCDGSAPWVKQSDGKWRDLHVALSSHRFGNTLHLRTLTPPAPVTAETIRQSEPGSTWVTPGGSVFEWTGSLLVPHTEDGGLHSAGTPDPDSIGGWPLTRSTAAPRGDYGKKELPEVVALAEVLGDFAVADEHNGDRDDMQLARLLVGRGVKVVTDE